MGALELSGLGRQVDAEAPDELLGIGEGHGEVAATGQAPCAEPSGEQQRDSREQQQRSSLRQRVLCGGVEGALREARERVVAASKRRLPSLPDRVGAGLGPHEYGSVGRRRRTGSELVPGAREQLLQARGFGTLRERSLEGDAGFPGATHHEVELADLAVDLGPRRAVAVAVALRECAEEGGLCTLEVATANAHAAETPPGIDAAVPEPDRARVCIARAIGSGEPLEAAG